MEPSVGPCSIDYGIQLLMNPRLAARAIDALPRGWPVTVSAGAKGYELIAIATASDSALAGFDGEQQAEVLISARRAETLKLTNQPSDEKTENGRAKA